MFIDFFSSFFLFFFAACLFVLYTTFFWSLTIHSLNVLAYTLCYFCYTVWMVRNIKMRIWCKTEPLERWVRILDIWVWRKVRKNYFLWNMLLQSCSLKCFGCEGKVFCKIDNLCMFFETKFQHKSLLLWVWTKRLKYDTWNPFVSF